MEIRKWFKRKEKVDLMKEKKMEAIDELTRVAKSIIDRYERKDKRFHDVPVQFERRHA